MNLLERIEQRVLFERLVIGLEEPVLVKGIGEISAKVDSGNGGFNVLHGTDLYQEGDMLHFKTVDGQGQVKQVATKVVDRIEVNIGGGHIQDRPVVELDIKFANTLYKKIPFSITDRGDNDNKILICKQFVQDELDALIDVGEKNISKKNVQVQAVNERSSFGRSSSGSTVGKLLHTGADAVKDGMKAVGSGAKTLGKKAGNIGSWLNGVADKAKAIRQGNWNGSFIFTPLGKVLEGLGGIISSEFAQALGVGAAAVALVGSFPWLFGMAALGYGLWRFSNLKLKNGEGYKPPKDSLKRAEELKGKYKKLFERVSKNISDKSFSGDKSLLADALGEDDAKKFDFDGIIPLVDKRGKRLDGNMEVVQNSIEDLDERYKKIYSYLDVAQKMSEKNVFKNVQDAKEGSETEPVSDSYKVPQFSFSEEDCRLLTEARAAFLVEDTVDPDDDDESEDDDTNTDEGKKKKDDDTLSKDGIDKVFAKLLEDAESNFNEQEKFFEAELFSKRCFVLYYIPFVGQDVADFKTSLEGGKFDKQMANDFNGFDASSPDKSFATTCKAMESEAKGFYGICLQGDGDAETAGDRHAVVCLRSSEWNAESFKKIVKKVKSKRTRKTFDDCFGVLFELQVDGGWNEDLFKSISEKVGGDDAKEMFGRLFCAKFSKVCADVGFDIEASSRQFDDIFGKLFESKDGGH